MKAKNIKNNKNNNLIKKMPLDKAYYIVGFADGEGSFNISFRKRDDYLIGWKIAAVFNVSQKEKTILCIIKKYLGCGTIRFRNDNFWVYEVDNKNSLLNVVIPFFSKYKFLSEKKKKDFSRFKKLTDIICNNKTKTYDNIVSILKLLEDVSSKNSRKYNDKEILDRASIFWAKNKRKIELKNSLDLKSSETNTPNV